MRFFPSSILVVLTLVAFAAEARDRPLLGDVENGKKLLKEADAKVRVDGAWLNQFPDSQILKMLESGKGGFPEVESDNVLDTWDALAALRAQNTNLRDLSDDVSHVYVAETELDVHAKKRLTDEAKIKAGAIEDKRRVFVTYVVEGTKASDDPAFVNARQARKRDQLKKDFKKGYVVFVKLPGFRGGAYEVAFAIDTDIKITDVVVRDATGNAPADLNQAAHRFVGKGARGRYDSLKAGGAGKAIGELQDPLSDAFLMAAESIYMFEVDERDYFAFD